MSPFAMAREGQEAALTQACGREEGTLSRTILPNLTCETMLVNCYLTKCFCLNLSTCKAGRARVNLKLLGVKTQLQTSEMLFNTNKYHRHDFIFQQ